MKILEKEFTSKGFSFNQIIREGDTALYQVKSIKGKSQSFEVIHVKSHNGYEIQGVKIPPSEVYPSSSQWGVYGWTYTTLEDAQRKYKSIKKPDVVAVRQRAVPAPANTAFRKRR